MKLVNRIYIIYLKWLTPGLRPNPTCTSPTGNMLPTLYLVWTPCNISRPRIHSAFQRGMRTTCQIQGSFRNAETVHRQKVSLDYLHDLYSWYPSSIMFNIITSVVNLMHSFAPLPHSPPHSIHSLPSSLHSLTALPTPFTLCPPHSIHSLPSPLHSLTALPTPFTHCPPHSIHSLPSSLHSLTALPLHSLTALLTPLSHCPPAY